MKQWPNFLLLLLIGVSATGMAYSRPLAVTPGEVLVTFRFLPGEDRLFLQGNETELNRLYTLVDTYHTEITSGKTAVSVEPVVPERQERHPEPAIPAKPYDFALRTNLLYDAFLLPAIGLEWRVNSSMGIKLDGSFSR